MLVTVAHFHPSLIFLSKVIVYKRDPYTGLLFEGLILTWPANIRLGYKWVAVKEHTRLTIQ